MVFSTLIFIITTMLSIACANAINLSEGDIPVLSLIIPALWVFPQGGFAGLILLASLTIFGLTLPLQPIALSVGVWVLFPLMMVSFSRRSSIRVVLMTFLILITLQVGIMVTQAGGKLEGSAMLTAIQTLSVMLTWYAATHWTSSNRHSWWSLAFVLPLWFAGLTHAALVTLCIVGMIAAVETLPKYTNFSWNKLLCWTLPTVGFAALVISPSVDVPKPIFVVWLCLLGTAWVTDYILRSEDADE